MRRYGPGVKFFVESASKCSKECMDSWKTPKCEVLGFIDVDDAHFAFFRVQLKAKLPEEDFQFVTNTLKEAGGTYWYAARVWIVEQEALSEAVDAIRRRLGE